MNAHSGLCLSPAGGGRDKNGEIVQFTCDQDPSRFWSFTVVEGDMVEITNLNSGLCLTIAGGNTERNIVSVQYTCDSDPSVLRSRCFGTEDWQLWSLRKLSSAALSRLQDFA